MFKSQGKEEKEETTKEENQTPEPPKRHETAGSLSTTDSIFGEEAEQSAVSAAKETPSEAEQDTNPFANRSYENMQMALDPNPKSRNHWLKKKIAHDIRHRGRLSKSEKILRTERQAMIRSHWFETSLKKLGPLARQIAGKNIDEAIVQMQFSKKKAAKDVLGHLEHARNEAITRWGMGLTPEPGDPLAPSDPITVTFKNGQRKKITNPTSIYIAQAWVNRGSFTRDQEYRARGQVNIINHPSTALGLLLKEERTRIREWKDRDAHALRKRKAQLWSQLPDRAIYAQNQYYSW